MPIPKSRFWSGPISQTNCDPGLKMQESTDLIGVYPLINFQPHIAIGLRDMASSKSEKSGFWSKWPKMAKNVSEMKNPKKVQNGPKTHENVLKTCLNHFKTLKTQFLDHFEKIKFWPILADFGHPTPANPKIAILARPHLPDQTRSGAQNAGIDRSS